MSYEYIEELPSVPHVFYVEDAEYRMSNSGNPMLAIRATDVINDTPVRAYLMLSNTRQALQTLTSCFGLPVDDAYLDFDLAASAITDKTFTGIPNPVAPDFKYQSVMTFCSLPTPTVDELSKEQA